LSTIQVTSLDMLFIKFVIIPTTFNYDYNISLHDALPISWLGSESVHADVGSAEQLRPPHAARLRPPTSHPSQLVVGDGPPQTFLDRKSTRLNSSHDQISYAVFCLKKKK